MCICTTESGRISCCIIRVHLVSKSYRSLPVINKMAKSLNCCGLFMLTVFATLCTEIISKPACEGDSVLIFQNITSARFKETITLYKEGHGEQYTIALWVLNDSKVEVKIRDRYKPKVLFENGSIILRNIESTDEATYVLVYDSDTSTKNETNISILVPPTHHCKPAIRQDENVLFAFLNNSENCGTPHVSVQWLEYPGISYKMNKTLIEVPYGKDACTYSACIEGEALKCTRKSAEREYCERYTIGSTRKESTPEPSFDIQQLQTLQIVSIVITISVLLIILAVVIFSSIIVWKYCRSRHTYPERAPSREQWTYFSSLQNLNVTDPETGHEDHEYETLPLQ